MNFLHYAKSILFQKSSKIYQFYSDITDVFAFYQGLRRGYFSQDKEDLFLLEYFAGKIGHYIDIGANHPFRYSNTYLLYKKGWRGINIEPMPSKYRKLVKIKPEDINLNMGVGSNNGSLKFYEMYPSVYSTFDGAVCEESLQKNRAVLIDSYDIPVETLSDIHEKYFHFQTIDLLSVDTEGYEMEVLKGIDWDKLKPKLIIIETKPKINSKDYGKDDVIDFLTIRGYKFIKQINRNSILELAA